MKKYIYISLVAILSIFAIQSLYINSLYSGYLIEKRNNIDDNIYQSVDLEHYVRYFRIDRKPEFKRIITYIDDMPQKIRDSLLAIHPLPEKPRKSERKGRFSREYDIQDLMSRGVIKSTTEIDLHEQQDYLYFKGNPINVKVLDSILNSQLENKYQIKIEIRNDKDSLLSNVGSVENPNYISKRVQIGFEGYQFIKVYANIPLSNFFVDAILAMVLSLLIICISVVSLIILLTTIRRKNEALELREQCVGGIIHELKSPIGSIVTMLSIMKISEKDSVKQDIIATNRTIVTSLLNKIDLLLEASRYSKGRIVVNKTAIDSKIIEERISQIKAILTIGYNNKSNCNISIENRLRNDKILYLDTLLMDTILTNLIENSIKYSNDNVDIKIVLDTNAQNQFVISVNDNGFGIEKKHLKKIFKQYYRVDNKGIKGYGIGLSYLKTISIAHGGSITVESEIGKGSKFEVKLNVEKNG